MAGTNAYANLVRNRKPKGGRRKLDDYETPSADTERLCRFVKFRGPILEPAAGSGRMARALATWTGKRVTTADLKRGQDFLARTKKWAGDIVTNPPYHDGMATAFVQKALELADGRVAMLLELKYLAGAKRAKFYNANKPEALVVIPNRIYFLVNGKPIKSQFYSHCWIVWPPRALRDKGRMTSVHWAEDEFG
jgi:predicted RNA methylase